MQTVTNGAVTLLRFTLNETMDGHHHGVCLLLLLKANRSRLLNAFKMAEPLILII